MMKTLIPSLFEEFEDVCKSLTCSKQGPTQTHSFGVSISEDTKNFYLEVPVPGIKSEEIELFLDRESRVISIKAEGKVEQKKEDVQVHAQAMRRFSYEFPLSSCINVEGKVEAVCKDGILSVSLPKCTAAEPCKIAVRTA